MNRPKDWWGDPKKAQEWIDQNKKRTESGDYTLNTTVQSTFMVVDEIEKRSKDFKKVLEVGAGDGRLIGALSEQCPKIKCYSVDINKKLSAYVKKNYRKVKKCSVGDIIKLPFKDNEFDLVFTYQVLQHIPKEDFESALKELKRVSKQEIWMWEGIGRVSGYCSGSQTSKCHNGSYVWHIGEYMDCYAIEVPKSEHISLDRQRLYKVKK